MEMKKVQFGIEWKKKRESLFVEIEMKEIKTDKMLECSVVEVEAISILPQFRNVGKENKKSSHTITTSFSHLNLEYLIVCFQLES